MIDVIIYYFKLIVGLCIGAWLIWMGITHAAELAYLFVTVINAIKVFVTTLVNGVV